MLASDDNNPNFVNAIKNPDETLTCRFFKRAILNPFMSEKEGRDKFDDVTYVEIFKPGDTLSVVCRPMYGADQLRFPRQWAAFASGHVGDQREMGTALSRWHQLTEAQCEELKAIKFFTLEMLAGASDLQLQNIGMICGVSPFTIRQGAQDFLSARAGMNVAQQSSNENAELKERLAAMEAQMQALLNKPAIEVVDIVGTPTITAKLTKPKKTLSPEHLAKLAAGREAKKAAASA